MDLIIFPDVDVLVGDYLTAGLALQGEALHVSTQESTEHREYIRIRSTGGGQAALTLDDAQVTIECFADDETRAMHLATLSRAIVQYMGRDNKSGVLAILGDSRPVILPHPSGLARATFTFTARFTPIRRKQ